MDEPRLFATYVDELKLVGPSRFAARITCPMLLVRSIESLDDDGDEPAFDTKVTHRDEIAPRTNERPSDRPRDAAPRIAPGVVLRIEKRQGGAFRERIGIGRAPNVDVRIALAQISKYHAYIARDGDEWTLTDAGSSNGTYVRGAVIDPRIPIALADTTEIGFGGCRMRFYTADGFVRFVSSRVR